MITSVPAPSPVVLYHADCLDGFTSAWVADKYMRNNVNATDWKFIPVSYGEPPPEEATAKGTQLFILDFCYSLEGTLELASTAAHIIILDHHITAKERLGDLDKLPSNVQAIFDMKESGASLAWKYFFPDSPMPELVELVKDRDLWLFTEERTKPFNAGLFYSPRTFHGWDSAKNNMEDVIATGEILAKAATAQIKELMPQAKVLLALGPDDIPMWAYNMPPHMASEAGNLAVLEPAHYLGITFTLGGSRVKFSVRSVDHKDSAADLAAYYGGGGHRNAAGFSVPMDVFITMLKYNRLKR